MTDGDQRGGQFKSKIGNVKNSQVAVGHGAHAESMQSPSGADQKQGFWTLSRKIGAAVVGLAGIVTAVVAVLEYVH
jgi:hypothetical protein